MIEKTGSISTTTSFVVGLAAGAVAIAISLIIRSFAGGPFIPELASQTLFSLTPGQFESQAVANFGPLAKYSAFAGAIIANFILYGLLAIWVDRLQNKLHRKGYVGKAILSSVVAYVILLIVTISLVTITEARTHTQPTSIIRLVLSLILPQIAFGFTLSSFYEKIRRPSRKPVVEKPSETTTQIDYKKRALLRAAIASAVALPILYLGLNRLFPTQEVQPPSSSSLSLLPLQSKSKPLGFEDPRLAPLLDSEVTPTYLFYRIDINPIVPVVDATSWTLTVKGLVNNPLTITYEEIKAMPPVKEYATLQCVSNKIGGDLTSTALWKGVRLKDVLQKAQVKPGAKYIAVRCYDGYDVGIPLERGLLDGSILAYEMNLAPLTSEHGYPVRAIVPGLYGMMNPKWITEIELVDNVYEGYWARNGWTNVATEDTHSFIVIPGQAPVRDRFRNLDVENINIVPGQKVPVAGIAFAGDRGIAKVEVSTDGGVTWKSASIKDPLSKYTWVLWTAGFTPATAQGNYRIVVRATDKTGKIQTAEVRPPFPDGATGYHMINI
ncbi:MAG: molybdopterin-dependent oxidoreductase [Nitrosopumilales archaeon]|nr:molybdopterin-dependent oxidoreductase [Nitrosopumilales archaeon]MRN60912.1 molybdopterin-dependent oxidoreductase [Nitrosopumilales archaeon]